MSDYSGHLGELSEEEMLARLTGAEKRRLARTGIVEFPHLDHEMLDSWLRGHGADRVPVRASFREKTDILLDRCETLVRPGEDSKALDRSIYGQLSHKSLEGSGVDPEEVAKRKPLETWEDVYIET